ncbi:MAG: DNA-deoxyinosine glycosylase [Gallionella sp.]
MDHLHGFPPIENSIASILILGSAPSAVSLKKQEYYAHPRNVFWRIMGDLVGASPELPYNARTQLLISSKIALWDVLASCSRSGSLDADIVTDTITPNDFSSFFLDHPHIMHVFFNGAMAENSFQKYVLPNLGGLPLHCLRLPSTSPAHAAIRYEQKLEAWKVIYKKLNPA